MLYALTKHPKVLARLQKELDAVMGPEQTIDLNVAKTIPYLDAVIHEGLRLYSSAPARMSL
jgi:cytochrome P450